MDPVLWLLLVVMVILSWLKINQWLFNDFLSPFNLLLPAWVLPLLLKLLRLSQAERPWRDETILMIGWATLSLGVVSLAPAFLLRSKRNFWQGQVWRNLATLLQRRGVTVVLSLWFAIRAVAVIYNEFVTNPVGIPIITYLRNPDISRDPYWQWKGESLWFLSIPVFTLTPVFYLKFKIATSRGRKLLFLGAASFYPLVELVKMSRSECIYALSSIALMEYYYRRSIQRGRKRNRLGFKTVMWRLVFVGTMATAALFSATLFQQIRANKPMLTSAKSMAMVVDFPEPYASTVVEVYGYFALPFENFSNFVNDYPGGWNLGVGALRPVFSATGWGGTVRGRLENINFDKYLEMLPINTYPFLASIYAEAGWVGILLAPPFYAAVVGFIYLRFRTRPNLEILVLYTTVISYCWLWMFSNQNFTGVQYYLYAAAIWPIHLSLRALRSRRTLPTSAAP